MTTMQITIIKSTSLPIHLISAFPTCELKFLSPSWCSFFATLWAKWIVERDGWYFHDGTLSSTFCVYVNLPAPLFSLSRWLMTRQKITAVSLSHHEALITFQSEIFIFSCEFSYLQRLKIYFFCEIFMHRKILFLAIVVASLA